MRVISFVLFFVSSWAFAFAPAKPPAPQKPIPKLDKVMIVLFENEDASQVQNQPFFKEFAARGASLLKLKAITHPSQPNYIALTSGGTQGVTGDGNRDLNVRNLTDLIEAKGKTWKAYIEGWPGKCYTGERKGAYARKHNPFISYLNIQKNPARCANIVDASQLDQDLAAGTIPDYSFYTPDMNNDGHDTSVEFADRYFRERFKPLIDDRRFANVTLIATFDEGATFGSNIIYGAIVGPQVAAGTVSRVAYNHYSLLRTIEVALDVGDLAGSDVSAPYVDDVWK